MPCAIVIPIYNHGQRILPVLDQARELGLPIIVVDDGSTDQTPALLAGRSDIRLLRHQINQGKGAALITGFAQAVACGYDWALTLDGDGQHRPADGTHLLALAQGPERPLVIGRRRDMRGAHVPWTSRFGRGFSNFWVQAAGGPRVADSQSGFRLYPLPETLNLPVAARRYQYEVEVLVRANRAAIPVLEAEVGVIYQEQRISHFRPWLDFWRNAATFGRLICGRLFVRGRR
jgi:glycosyltransferase involved in cell wall biosynthesis